MILFTRVIDGVLGQPKMRAVAADELAHARQASARQRRQSEPRRDETGGGEALSEKTHGSARDKRNPTPTCVNADLSV